MRGCLVRVHNYCRVTQSYIRVNVFVDLINFLAWLSASPLSLTA